MIAAQVLLVSFLANLAANGAWAGMHLHFAQVTERLDRAIGPSGAALRWLLTPVYLCPLCGSSFWSVVAFLVLGSPYPPTLLLLNVLVAAGLEEGLIRPLSEAAGPSDS
jgi:hypothetical protein